jgi:hypothetical protein
MRKLIGLKKNRRKRMEKVEFNHDSESITDAVPAMDPAKVDDKVASLVAQTKKFSILIEWVYNNSGDVNTATAIAHLILNGSRIFEKVYEPKQDA